jgi:CHASE3 domain sensor protein
MRVNLKDRIILLLSLLTIILFISSIGSYQNLSKQRKLANHEISKRMESEEKIVNLSNRNKDLEQQLNRLQAALSTERTNYKSDTRALNNEILRLKDELEKTIQLKESLREQLRQSAVSQTEPR